MAEQAGYKNRFEGEEHLPPNVLKRLKREGGHVRLSDALAKGPVREDVPANIMTTAPDQKSTRNPESVQRAAEKMLEMAQNLERDAAVPAIQKGLTPRQAEIVKDHTDPEAIGTPPGSPEDWQPEVTDAARETTYGAGYGGLERQATKLGDIMNSLRLDEKTSQAVSQTLEKVHAIVDKKLPKGSRSAGADKIASMTPNTFTPVAPPRAPAPV